MSHKELLELAVDITYLAAANLEPYGDAETELLNQRYDLMERLAYLEYQEKSDEN